MRTVGLFRRKPQRVWLNYKILIAKKKGKAEKETKTKTYYKMKLQFFIKLQVQIQEFLFISFCNKVKPFHFFHHSFSNAVLQKEYCNKKFL